MKASLAETLKGLALRYHLLSQSIVNPIRNKSMPANRQRPLSPSSSRAPSLLQVPNTPLWWGTCPHPLRTGSLSHLSPPFHLMDTVAGEISLFLYCTINTLFHILYKSVETLSQIPTSPNTPPAPGYLLSSNTSGRTVAADSATPSSLPLSPTTTPLPRCPCTPKAPLCRTIILSTPSPHRSNW